MKIKQITCEGLNSKAKCTGSRRQLRKGIYGTFKCSKVSQGWVETHVGFSEHHACCGDEECIASIAKGYPAHWKES